MNVKRFILLEAHTAATEVIELDLPIFPISHIILTIDCYNATDEATVAELLAFINNIKVTRGGVTIVDLQSEDLSAEMCYLYGSPCHITKNLATDNQNRAISLFIPFGRDIMLPDECFPASRATEVKLFVDMTAPATSADNGQVNIECVCLPDAKPAAFLKSTARAVSAPGATGWNAVPLNCNNPYVALLLFNTTVPLTSSHTYGIDKVELLLDGDESFYNSSKMHCLMSEKLFRIASLPRDIAAIGSDYPANYAWLDFDPHRDGSFLLQTKELSKLELNLYMGVDEICRIVSLELVDNK